MFLALEGDPILQCSACLGQGSGDTSLTAVCALLLLLFIPAVWVLMPSQR